MASFLPRVTVLLSVFNGEKEQIFIAVHSILNQTYKNFRFLIIDDGSSASIAAFLLELQKLDRRIEIIRNEKK